MKPWNLNILTRGNREVNRMGPSAHDVRGNSKVASAVPRWEPLRSPDANVPTVRGHTKEKNLLRMA